MMATHGTGLFRSLLIGSVTAKVLHDARCPVWIATRAEEQ
jgi:nucleotide-binding universal stress UspA family protein